MQIYYTWDGVNILIYEFLKFIFLVFTNVLFSKKKLEKLISSSKSNYGDPYGVRTHECSLERAMC